MHKKIIAAFVSCSFLLSGIFSVSTLVPIEASASSYNELAERPFMGWSSWSSIRKKPTEDKIKAAADVLASKFKSHGYEYVNLDDYYMLDWRTTVDEYGRWAVDPEKFPNGMKALGDYIHNKGLKFGHYVTLGIPRAAIEQNTPIEGTPYHAKDIVDFSKGQKKNFNYDEMYAIDFSKPGAQEFIDSWARLFASYGIDYIKIDGVRNQDIADVEAWAKALEKTGRPIHVELSNNLDIKHISTWKQLSNGWRTDHDVEAYGTPYLASWKKVTRRFDDVAQWQPHAGPGGWNDLDSLNVANGSKDGLTNDEKISYVSLWAIAASQFVIGNDLTKLDDFGLSLLTNDEILGVNQSGVAGKRLYKKGDTQVFYQSLPDGSYNIALFNTGSSKHDVTVKWADIGIEGAAFVRDLWSHQDLGSMEKSFTATLSSHGSRMIKVVPTSALIVSPESGATGVNPSKVTLNWEAVPNVDSYHVQVATDPSIKNIVVDQTVSLPNADVKNLEKDTRYYWKVSSLSGEKVNQIGIYSFHTEITKAPNDPDWVLADRQNNDSVSLSWNPTFGAESYTIYRKEVNILGLSSDYKQIASDISTPNYMDNSAELKSGVTYSYKVTASNKLGESKKSTEGYSDDQSSVKKTALLIVSFTLGALAIIFIIARIKSRSTKQADLANTRAS
ncbi:alpha-galactosidase [Neobacillus sp. 179-C4.2 HS]|uniref:Alpha-galactosidase n=1 Tax=Neobacillus driksii TaxID=3035913 RepID=A0ABV4YU48_9BACI|nr:alpha-galactosidase [Neobacillus sp. 179.-C4.2 HS]MDP5193011.1 alpha-galactosidase [Neobacillus sp. 179.-C4.2 HS]